jgi:16S rRNA processing protein RimM
LYVRPVEQVESRTVTDSRADRDRWVVGFAGLETIDDAEAMRGLELRVPATDLKVLGPGAFYVHDLVGCLVRTVSGEDVGPVVSVDLATGVPVLTVAAGGEVLVPFVDAICRRVDPVGRVIEIDPPNGLIDLNRLRGGRR